MSKVKTFSSAEALTRAASYISRNRGELKSCKTVRDIQYFFAKMDGFVGHNILERYKKSLSENLDISESETVEIGNILSKNEIKHVFDVWYSCFPEEIQEIIDREISWAFRVDSGCSDKKAFLLGDARNLVFSNIGYKTFLQKVDSNFLKIEKFEEFALFYYSQFKCVCFENPMGIFSDTFTVDCWKELYLDQDDIYEVQMGRFDLESDEVKPYSTFNILLIADSDARAKSIAEGIYSEGLTSYEAKKIRAISVKCVEKGKSFYDRIWMNLAGHIDVI